MKRTFALLILILAIGCEDSTYSKTIKKCRIIDQYPYQDWSLAIHPETKWKIITECGDTITSNGSTTQDSITFIYLKPNETY